MYFPHSAFLIQKIKKAQLAFDERNAWLVIAELNTVPGKFLSQVLLLLQLKHMLTRTCHIFKT